MDRPATEDLTVRLPRQQRSKEAWARVLDAGVGLLEDGGYGAFTIAAVCARAEVAPPAIYARTTSKEALFLAVYEHGITRLQSVRAVFADDDRWQGRAAEELVRAAVAATVDGMLAHRRFLRAVVLLSADHAEVRRRGAEHVRGLGEGFAAVVAAAGSAITHPDARVAIWSCFHSVFAAVVLRVAYGEDFATAEPLDDDSFGRQQGEAAVRYLLGAAPRP